MHENEISQRIIGAAIEVHKVLEPGLLESAYETSLQHELVESGLEVRRQVGLPLVYKGARCEVGYRIDLLVEGKVLVEIKSLQDLLDIHTAQVLTYLKLSGCSLALLINFNVPLLKDGIRRLVHHFQD